ncbi:MAG: MBL fold metallo-hydrolase [Promethearchaeota archaeon]
MEDKIITTMGKVSDFMHLVDLREFGMRKVLAAFIGVFNENTIIMDCGSSLEVKRIIRYLKKNKISLKSVKYLIPTHHHFDHAGGMWWLYEEIKKYNPKIKILTNSKTKQLLNDYKAHLARAKRTYGEFSGIMKTIEDNAFKLIKPSNNFSKDPKSLEIIDTFMFNNSEVKMVIMNTPGHTHDHQCPLFIRNNEIEFLYAGEATGTIYHSSKLITMPTSMPIYFKYNSFISTLDKLLQLKTPKQLGLTHFGVVNGVENVKIVFEDQKAFLKDFRKKVIQYYQEKPETEYVFKKLIPYFAARTDISGGSNNELALGNIVLGVVYGMMMDLGFRKK